MGGEDAEIAIRFRVMDEDWEVQIAALDALGEMKAVESAEAVARAAVEGQILKVRRAAARALRAMEIPEIFARVLKVVKRGRDAEPRIHALETAPQLARPEDAEAISALCGDRDLRVRTAAYRALGATRSPEAITTLLRGLRDKETAVRVAAGVALGEIGGPEALKGIVDLELKETDPYVTERLSRALRKLDPAEVAQFLADSARAQRKGEHRAKTGNDVVEIEAASPGHPLLEGVFTEETRPMWWLEVIAFPMRVVDPFRTEILIDSVEMLSRKYGSSTMAVAFEYGHGTVEHCISHFFLQEEGFTNQSTKLARKVFAADNLGIPFGQIRKLEANAFFDGQPNEEMTKEIAQDYSMFKLIVNFVIKKRKQVEQE